MNFPGSYYQGGAVALVAGIAVGLGLGFVFPSATQSATAPVVKREGVVQNSGRAPNRPGAGIGGSGSFAEVQQKIDLCFADPDPAARDALLYGCIGKLSAADLKAVVEQGQIPNKREAVNMALDRWFEIAPGEAVNFVKAVLEKTAANEGMTSAQRAEASVGPTLDLGDAMAIWGRHSPGEAIQFAMAQKTKTRTELLNNALPAYAAVDPAAAFQTLGALSIDPTTRQDLAAKMVQKAATSNLPAALAALQDQPRGTDQSQMLAGVLAAGATVDPKTVLSLAIQDRDRLNDEVLDGIATTVARDDPETALEAAKGLPNPKARVQFEAGPIAAWTRMDPDEAWAYSCTQFAGKEQEEALGTISHDAARDNPDLVAGWLAQLPEGSAKETACMQLLFQWSDREPERAAAWTVQLPEGNNKVDQICRVTNHWAVNDPKAAAKWLDTLPSGKARDYASSNFAWRVMRNQPTMALDRAALISDPKLQKQVLTRLYPEVMATSPETAEAWLASSSLADTVKQSLAPARGP